MGGELHVCLWAQQFGQVLYATTCQWRRQPGGQGLCGCLGLWIFAMYAVSSVKRVCLCWKERRICGSFACLLLLVAFSRSMLELVWLWLVPLLTGVQSRILLQLVLCESVVCFWLYFFHASTLGFCQAAHCNFTVIVCYHILAKAATFSSGQRVCCWSVAAPV